MRWLNFGLNKNVANKIAFLKKKKSFGRCNLRRQEVCFDIKVKGPLIQGGFLDIKFKGPLN